MKKKVLSLVLCLMMCVAVFAGCNLISRNDQKYYEAVVCTIDYVDGTKDEITKRELLMGYNSYGYNYVQNYGYTQKQAVMTTLDTIVNQHLTIKAVENHYDKLNEGLQETDAEYQPILNENETTYLWDTTYDAVYTNLKEYFNDILGITNAEDEQESANSSVFKEYKRQAYLEEVDGKLVIKKTATSTTIRQTYPVRTAKVDGKDVVCNFEEEYFKDAMYVKLHALAEGNTTSAKNWKSAFNKYLKAIKDNYSYKTFASDKDCFMFEMDRVYNILKDNYYVEKYETLYNNSQYREDNISNVTVDNVLKYYSSKVKADYAQYVTNEKVSEFENSILNDVANVDYVLKGENVADYFYVGYVKLEFDETQKAKYDSIENDAYITDKAAEYDKVYAGVKATERNAKTGEKTDVKIDAQVLLNDYIKKDIADAGTYTGNKEADKFVEQDKAEAFRKYLYLYNDDDTLKGAERNAVFGVKGNEVLANSTFADNQNVKDAILALYKSGKAKVGDVSELVRADDGLYVFFYAGDVKNLFDDVNEHFDASKIENSVKVLSSTRLNIFSGKKVFDSIYETLTKDNFAVFQNMDMQNLRGSLAKDIVAIENYIKDLY